MSVARIFLASALFSLMANAITSSSAQADDHQAVMEAQKHFYSALNAIFVGDTKPMAKVWSHEDDITYLGPDGHMHAGWKDIREYWQKQADKKLGGDIKTERQHVFMGNKLAVVQNYEVGENTADGKVQKVSIRATNVFRKEDGAWKMISHHTDLLPFLQD